MNREITIDSLEEMCDLMCGGIEDIEKKYLIIDSRLGKSEQDDKEYTLEDLKYIFKMDLDKVNDEDKDYFENFNNILNECFDIDALKFLLDLYEEDYFTFVEVNND